jgi:hypothetical protein
MAAVRQRKNIQSEEDEAAGLLRVLSTSGGSDSSEYMSAGPTVSSLLERVETKTNIIDPTFSGYMLKRGYRFGNLLTCCPSCCGCSPTWKKRFFVIRGGFLFRFTSSTRTARPKGTPIPLSDATIDVVRESDDDDNVNEDVSLLLCVSTIRKEYIFRTDTTEKRDEWVKRLRIAKQISIKVSLGHVKEHSVDKKAREAGERMFHNGIRREREAISHETEMRNLGNMGGY